jgi:hypothetical protein
LKTILSFKFKISILVVLILLIPGIYFAITQLSVPVEQDLMSEFKAAPAVPSGKQDATDGIAPVDVLLVGLKQRLETQQPNRTMSMAGYYCRNPTITWTNGRTRKKHSKKPRPWDIRAAGNHCRESTLLARATLRVKIPVRR